MRTSKSTSKLIIYLFALKSPEFFFKEKKGTFVVQEIVKR